MTRRIFALTVVAAWSLFAGSQAAASTSITSFHSRVEVDPEDASLAVTETVSVTSDGTAPSSTIRRDFPAISRGPLGLQLPITFEIISVHLDGQPEPFRVTGLVDGRRLTIGGPHGIIPPGTHTYTIVYRTSGQILPFPTYDQLTWDATGSNWDLPVPNPKVTVLTPPGAQIVDSGTAAPSASLGKPGTPSSPDDISITKQRDHTAIFSATRPLQPGESFTVTLPFTKGALDLPQLTTGALLHANIPYLIGAALVLGAIVFQCFAWLAVGKDPPPGHIVPQSDPPAGYSAAACRYLKRMAYDDRCFAAAVVGLAAKNALRISGSPDTRFLLLHPDPDTTRAPLTPDERDLAEELLRNREHVAIDTTSHRQIAAARNTLRTSLASLLEKSHFVRNLHLWSPAVIATLLGVALSLFNNAQPAYTFALGTWLSLLSVAVAFLLSRLLTSTRVAPPAATVRTAVFTTVVLVAWTVAFLYFRAQAGTGTVLLVSLGTAASVLFYHLIKAPTHAGRDVLDEIDGLSRFLSGQQDEPADPDTITPLLPYAIALGHEKPWADKLTRASSTTSPASWNPAWYTSGNTLHALGAATFATSLSTALATNLDTPPESADTGSTDAAAGGDFSGGDGGE